MRSIRTIPLVAAVAALVFVFTAGPVSAATKAPVKLGQKVNVKGTKDVSSKSSAKLDVELDDFYFDPTFIKAKAGEKITLEMENEGTSAHTFTSDELAVDQQVDPGKSAKLTFTVPSDGAGVPVPLPFHESRGHGRRGVHEGRCERERDPDPGHDQQLVGLRELRLLSFGGAAIAVPEEPTLRTRVRVVVVGDVAHVVVEPVLDGERLRRDPGELPRACARAGRRAARCRAIATRPSARNRSRTRRSSTRRPRGTTA